jgi:hypothetical protein
LVVYAKLHEVDHVLSDFVEPTEGKRIVPKLLEIPVGVFGEVRKIVPYTEGWEHVAEILQHQEDVSCDLVSSVFVTVHEDANRTTCPIYVLH